MSYARAATAPGLAEQKPPAGSVPSRGARLITVPGMAVTRCLNHIVASRDGVHDPGAGWSTSNRAKIASSLGSRSIQECKTTPAKDRYTSVDAA